MTGVVFGKGFLGKKIAEKLNYEMVGREIDVLDFAAVGEFLDNKKPEVVINAIGKTGRPNIDWCEDNKEETFKSNVIAAINLGLACSERGIYFVHIGSGCIYDGDNDGKGFSEEDAPNFYGPQFYAKTKILAEMALKEFPCLMLRIRMPIDDKPHERNLINKLLKYSKVIDAPNSMTVVPHLLEAIKVLVEKRKKGIYNIVNPGLISATEIMEMYREIVDSNHSFETFSLKELDAITKGKRANCYLRTDKLESEGIKLPEIHEAVRECLIKYRGEMSQ